MTGLGDPTLKGQKVQFFESVHRGELPSERVGSVFCLSACGSDTEDKKLSMSRGDRDQERQALTELTASAASLRPCVLVLQCVRALSLPRCPCYKRARTSDALVLFSDELNSEDALTPPLGN